MGNVSNPYALADLLFAAASDAARHWVFRSDRKEKEPKGFEADITFHGPISGTITTKNGTPAAGVIVAASEWTCCPSKRDIMTTDESGSFLVAHPGEVLHLFPGDRFQPQSIVVPRDKSILTVVLDPESDSLSVPVCGKPQHGYERMGWGQYGLQFDVPRHDARLFRGKADTDYVVHTVKPNHGKDRAEFWFGPNAMASTPDDALFLESETFATRSVVKLLRAADSGKGGVIGRDTRGRLPNGTMWRHIAISSEGARYRDVDPENATLFDRIINSACWVEFPKR